MGTDDAAGRRLAPETDHPPSLAERSLRRHTPEVGAVCGKAARTVLCGGRSVTSVPTASPPTELFRAAGRADGASAAGPGFNATNRFLIRRPKVRIQFLH